MINVVPLRYDTTFKKAFGKPVVFCQFVKDVLGVEIHVDRVIAGWRYPEPVGFVDIENDLLLKTPQKIKSDNITPQELKVIKDEAAWEQTKQNAFEDGQEKGRKKREEEMAHSMLQKGMELAMIAEITGLKLEDIEAIKSAEPPTE